MAQAIWVRVACKGQQLHTVNVALDAALGTSTMQAAIHDSNKFTGVLARYLLGVPNPSPVSQHALT